MTSFPPHPSADFSTLFSRAHALFSNHDTPLEHAEASLARALEALTGTTCEARSNQVATLFAWKVQLAERIQIAVIGTTNRQGCSSTTGLAAQQLADRQEAAVEAYHGVLDQGEALLKITGLWPSTRAYIYSELARCCVSLTLRPNSDLTKLGYHTSLQIFIENGLNELSEISTTASNTELIHQARLVICQCLAFSSVYQERYQTVQGISDRFRRNLSAANSIVNMSAYEKILLETAGLFVGRSSTINSLVLRTNWAAALKQLSELATREPFAGSQPIVTMGYLHLVAISKLTHDHKHITAAALGVAAALANDPRHAAARDEYLSLAYESSCASGDTAEAQRILMHCRILNLQGRFCGTARLRLFAAQRKFDPDPQELLSQGAIYEELFRSVTTPSKESTEVSFKVAKTLLELSADEFVNKVLSVFDLCRNTPQYCTALSENIRLLIESLARENVMAPFMATLARLHIVLPNSHRHLLIKISVRQLVAEGRTDNVWEVIVPELRRLSLKERDLLKPDLHLLAAIARLSSDKLALAERHIKAVLDQNTAERSETETRRRLLALTLEFICAFRSNKTDQTATSYSLLVRYFNQYHPTPIFSTEELGSSAALAAAIHRRIKTGSIYEEFERARFDFS